jgi:flagellar biogenesis protein FliO
MTESVCYVNFTMKGRKFVAGCAVIICCFALCEPIFGEEPPSVAPKETPIEDVTSEETSPHGLIIDVRHTFYKTVVVLLSLCGVIIGGGYLLKRLSGGRLSGFGTDGTIVLRERKYLSPKTALWVVEVNHQPLVVVDSQYGIAIQPLKPKFPPTSQE